MAKRFLYGDSVPFQLQYDFLATLETFIACGARVAQLEQELAELRAKHANAALSRQKSLDELRAFNATLLGAVRDAKKHASTQETAAFAIKVEEFAAHLIEDARRATVAASEAETKREHEETERRRGEVRGAVESFLTSGRLPALEAKIHMRLIDGRNEVTATFSNPHTISTSFTLAASQVPAWRAPRKVSDFMRGVHVQVGVKKSLFSRSVQPEVLPLDDMILGAFDLSDDEAEIHLRKKPEAKDTLVFRLIRHDADLTCEAQRPGDADGEQPIPVDSTDKLKLEQLWQLLRNGVGEVLQHKERLVGVRVEDKDLFAEAAVTPFFQRIIKLFAPIVAEISRRSPNPNELSLKLEDETGRREEIYVKKSELLAKLAPLTGDARALFAPFALGKIEPPLIEIRAELPSVDVTLDE